MVGSIHLELVRIESRCSAADQEPRHIGLIADGRELGALERFQLVTATMDAPNRQSRGVVVIANDDPPLPVIQSGGGEDTTHRGGPGTQLSLLRADIQ
jgi:hypothetical protein